jgi:hypothetical protein
MTAKFTTSRRIDAVAKAHVILRELKRTGQTIFYGQLAEAIGIIEPGERWAPVHRRRIGDTLYTVSIVAQMAGEQADIDFDRVLDKATGKPGAGNYKVPRVVFEPAPQETH